MALTEEQKRKLQEKAAVEIAAIRQKQEENEYYDRLLAEQGIVKTVHTQRDQKNEQTIFVLKIVTILFAVITGISIFFPYATVLGVSVGSVSDIAGNDWICLIVLSAMAFICGFCDDFINSMSSGWLCILAFIALNYSVKTRLASNDMYTLLQHGTGWYIYLIGSIGVSISSMVLVRLVPKCEKADRTPRQRFGKVIYWVGIVFIAGYMVLSLYHGMMDVTSSLNASYDSLVHKNGR